MLPLRRSGQLPRRLQTEHAGCSKHKRNDKRNARKRRASPRKARTNRARTCAPQASADSDTSVCNTRVPEALFATEARPAPGRTHGREMPPTRANSLRNTHHAANV